MKGKKDTELMVKNAEFRRFGEGEKINLSEIFPKTRSEYFSFSR